MCLILEYTVRKLIRLHLEAISSNFAFMSNRGDIFHLSVNYPLIHSEPGQQRGILFIEAPWSSTVLSPFGNSVKQSGPCSSPFGKWKYGHCLQLQLQLGLVQRHDVHPSCFPFCQLPLPPPYFVLSVCLPFFSLSYPRHPGLFLALAIVVRPVNLDVPISGNCKQRALIKLGFIPCHKEHSALLCINKSTGGHDFVSLLGCQWLLGKCL